MSPYSPHFFRLLNRAVSYLIQSNRGDRQQYASMVKECNAVGVQVIADVVINHMAGTFLFGSYLYE